MEVLKWSDKHTSGLLDASDRNLAYLALFNIFKENEYYCDLEDDSGEAEAKQRIWYDAALKGDGKAAFKLLQYRKNHGYEYEEDWDMDSVEDPKERIKG